MSDDPQSVSEFGKERIRASRWIRVVRALDQYYPGWRTGSCLLSDSPKHLFIGDNAVEAIRKTSENIGHLGVKLSETINEKEKLQEALAESNTLVLQLRERIAYLGRLSEDEGGVTLRDVCEVTIQLAQTDHSAAVDLLSEFAVNRATELRPRQWRNYARAMANKLVEIAGDNAAEARWIRDDIYGKG